MDSRETIAQLNKLENKYPVYEWRIGSFYIWPYIRFQLGSSLMTKGKVRKKKGFFDIFFRFLRAFFISGWAKLKDWKKNEKITKCDYLFWGNGVHSALIEDQIYHARTDPLIGKLKEKGYEVKKLIIGEKYEVPRKYESTFIQPKLNKILLLGKFKYKFAKSEQDFEMGEYDSFLAEISKMSVDANSLSKEAIARNIYIISLYKKYLKKLLLKANPKAIFMVCYYSTPGFAMIRACKELEIPVIDIQHGIQGDYHYAYGSWNNYSYSRKDSLLPDIFYVWGEKEAESISKWKSRDTKTFVGGNDYLKLWKFKQDENIQEYTDSVKEDYNISKYNKIILYTLGGFDLVDDNIIEAIRKSPADWLWFIRMHPKKTNVVSYWKQQLRDVNCTYHIDGVEKVPLYLLMGISDIHVTERSSTVMEASEFGLYSVVTDPESPVLYKKYIDSGNTFFAQNTKEILQYIKTLGKPGISVKQNEEYDIQELLDLINDI